jgi:cobalt-zinc-cadmium efflux system outer membrane protein
LTDQLYNVMFLQMKAGEVAAYEPMQIRVLAMQARGALVLAHNRYVAAWRQLAATLGTPGLALTAVEGRIDMPVPLFDHDQVLHFILEKHTDVLSAQLGVEKARLVARLAEVQPIPDITVHLGIQKDYTTPPFGTVANLNIGMPIPFWNRNQGNIQNARAQLGRAMLENARVRNDLTSKVAEAFQRYDNNRVLLSMYRDSILPNQVQAFRAAVARHAAVGDKSVSYLDLVNSQQTLANLITGYLTALNDQWSSVVDIAHLMQTRDLFQTQPIDEVAPIPDVYELYRERLLRHP